MVGLSLDNHYHFHYFGKTRKTIVLLNGLFASFQSWDACLEGLLKDFNVLQINFHGQGVLNFDDLEKVNLAEHAKQVYTLLQSLDIPKVYFIGLSHGGRVGLAIASEYPQVVEELIIANTYLNPDSALSAKLDSWQKANDEVDGKHRFDVALPWVWGRSFIEKNSDLINFYREKSNLLDTKLGCRLISQSKEFFHFDFTKFTGNLYVVSSDEDLLTPKVYQEQILMRSDLFNQAFHLEIQGGHASLIEKPEQVLELTSIWKKEAAEVEYVV
jgi:3-oxoadipate enol-lactonase